MKWKTQDADETGWTLPVNVLLFVSPDAYPVALHQQYFVTPVPLSSGVPDWATVPPVLLHNDSPITFPYGNNIPHLLKSDVVNPYAAGLSVSPLARTYPNAVPLILASNVLKSNTDDEPPTPQPRNINPILCGAVGNVTELSYTHDVSPPVCAVVAPLSSHVIFIVFGFHTAFNVVGPSYTPNRGSTHAFDTVNALPVAVDSLCVKPLPVAYAGIVNSVVIMGIINKPFRFVFLLTETTCVCVCVCVENRGFQRLDKLLTFFSFLFFVPSVALYHILHTKKSGKVHTKKNTL